MRDPFTEPFCRPEDLGKPLPDSEHAVSVCLPRWRDVVGYEEGDPAVLDTFECGYPRFLPHPLVAELCLAARDEFAKDDEVAIVFPSLAAAWRCAEYVKHRAAAACRLESYAWENLTAVLLPESAAEAAWNCWQHGGEIVSSRLAESALTDEPLDPETAEAGREAIAEVRRRVAASHDGVGPEDVFLFSSGMAAVAAVHRVLTRERPGLPTLQIEFPYLDSFKVQEQLSDAGVADFSVTSTGGREEVTRWFAAGNGAAAVFTEMPSNPLLRTADFAGVSPVLVERGVPLVIDDTVATAVNVDPFRYADVVTTSLTKVFSGAGDVAGGAVVVRPGSPFRETLASQLPDEEAASPLFARDALVLEVNSRHWRERVRATDENAAELVEWLRERPEVERVWHPSTECRDFYDAVRRDDGGYGSLISFVLRDGTSAAEPFYDALRICKGPSLGNDFSLLCPYTLLAHYGELEWAAERGVASHLLRISVGLEEPDDLRQRFEEAFEASRATDRP